jgi:cystathionine beta-lyase family protein involved in aluminum resistance
LLREDSITQVEPSRKSIEDRFLYIESLINYVNKQQLQEGDPLVNYTIQAMADSKNIGNDNFKNDESLALKYAALKLLYESVVRSSNTSISHTNSSLLQRNMRLERELNNIKNSKYWKIRKVLGLRH